MRAIVLDDSRSVRTIISKILADLGFEPLAIEDGRQALDRLAESDDIELALVDWNMPVMNGLEFVQAVRAQPHLQRLRLVMVTAENDVQQIRRALDAGANEYVMKPFTKDALLAKLALVGIQAPMSREWT